MKFRHGGSFFYLNGNYVVSGDESRYSYKMERLVKRGLRIGEDLVSKFPDSIDLKIIDRCSHGCPYCHESSTIGGGMFNLKETKRILSQLPTVGLEVAIGGGNVLDCLDDTAALIDWLQDRGNRPRITINWKDFLVERTEEEIEKVAGVLNSVTALGISMPSLKDVDLEDHGKEPWDKNTFLSNTALGKKIHTYTVFHVIAGLFPAEELQTLYDNISGAILVLGYKQWGRAKNTEVPDMTEWKKSVFDLINGRDINDYNTIGFDNLACEQLGVKEELGPKLWSEIYLGEEGSCSMYIDAVRGEYARTSRSPQRVSWNDVKLLDYYDTLKH